MNYIIPLDPEVGWPVLAYDCSVNVLGKPCIAHENLLTFSLYCVYFWELCYFPL